MIRDRQKEMKAQRKRKKKARKKACAAIKAKDMSLLRQVMSSEDRPSFDETIHDGW